ncbi:hypothetical protein TRICI_000639 [Trichomonascus ciferrii]|uniref:NIMA interactive protein n=1 Tax=Trichomonascus ciferrii TaxID=44093 RepID=A0A642VAR9_9ASCO|nr:hypothetical protein TRICI_000639 [Trichomonascus ciferrii]
MTAVTNAGDVRSAASYVNNVLVSKGYIRDDEKLEFGRQEEDEERDARTINVIYALLKTIDDDSKANEANEQLLKDFKRQREEENTRYERLKTKCEGLEKQVVSVERENSNLKSSADSFRRAAEQQREQSIRLKSLIKQIRQQFANELRRRDVQIAKLKERLQDTSRRTKTLTGVSGKLSKSYNSYSTTALSPYDSESEASAAISSELSAMNNALIAENNALLVMLHQIRDSISSVTDENQSVIISERTASYNEEPRDASEVLIRCQSTQELNEEVSDCIQYITQALHSPNYVSVTELKDKENEIQRLKDQLLDANTNWQKALSTMEQWKKYRENRSTINQPRMLRDSSTHVRHSKSHTNLESKVSPTTASSGTLSSKDSASPKSPPHKATPTATSNPQPRKSISSPKPQPGRKNTQATSSPKPAPPRKSSVATSSPKSTRKAIRPSIGAASRNTNPPTTSQNTTPKVKKEED